MTIYDEIREIGFKKVESMTVREIHAILKHRTLVGVWSAVRRRNIKHKAADAYGIDRPGRPGIPAEAWAEWARLMGYKTEADMWQKLYLGTHLGTGSISKLLKEKDCWAPAGPTILKRLMALGIPVKGQGGRHKKGRVIADEIRRLFKEGRFDNKTIDQIARLVKCSNTCYVYKVLKDIKENRKARRSNK